MSGAIQAASTRPGSSPADTRATAALQLHPVHGGRRICLGNTFAVIEATLLASMIAQRYELDLAAGPQEAEPTLTLRPRGGLPMRLRHR